MPRPGPRRQFVGARMSPEQIAALDELAGRLGVERSEVVRRAVDAYRFSSSTMTYPATQSAPAAGKGDEG